MEAYMSMITPYGCNFVIRSWGQCAGGLIAISQNDALFSLLGTNFGGDGRTTFGLPDLRGRAAISWGQGPGLSFHNIGAKGGTEQVTLTQSQMPMHNHSLFITTATQPGATSLPVTTGGGDASTPDGNYMAATSSTNRIYGSTLSSPPGEMGPIPLPSQQVSVQGSTMNTGGSQPVYTESPYQAVNYQICMYGIYPSRA
ncbi:MAG: tail fiber protein [Pseudomonadota bacterium]|nr:tail fiber protein [Pseudomonadota bacterium]